MKKILVVSALLSAILMAREMKVDTNHQQVIVVEPVVVTVQAPVAKKENTHVCPSKMQEPLAQKGTDSYKM